jgi:hypothetical protein
MHSGKQRRGLTGKRKAGVERNLAAFGICPHLAFKVADHEHAFALFVCFPKE